MAGSSSGAAAFQWGNKEPGTESSYESMCLNGVWYNVLDCVFCRSGMRKPFVGKLMRLFEDEDGARKVRIRWFFRPSELPVSVIKGFSTDIHNSNELFIALGNVIGVENENVADVILGKAMVLCTARYGVNTIPPRLNVDAVDFVFNRAYDVANQKVVKMANIPNKQLGTKLTNKLEWLAIGEGKKDEDLELPISQKSKSPMRMSKMLVGKRTSPLKLNILEGKRLKKKTRSINELVQAGGSEIIDLGKKLKKKTRSINELIQAVGSEIIDLDMLSN